MSLTQQFAINSKECPISSSSLQKVKDDCKQSFNDVYDEFSRFLNDDQINEEIADNVLHEADKIEALACVELKEQEEDEGVFVEKTIASKTSEKQFTNFKNLNKRFSCTSEEAEDGDSGFRDFTEEDSDSENLNKVFDTEDDDTRVKSIVSDFSDDDEDTLTFKMPVSVRESDSVDRFDKKECKTRRNETMSMNLLRSTISELERALYDSNCLLAKRDEEINDLRSQITRLNCKLREELKNDMQLKRDNEVLIKDKDQEINRLKSEISLILLESKDVNKTNNCKMFNETNESSPVSASLKTEDLADSLLHSPRCKNSSNPEVFKDSLVNCRSVGGEKPFSSKCKNVNQSLICTDEKSCFREKSKVFPEKTCKIELQAQLRMKFMRDAFFYYMIGFHADEQINAILAILDYGDKRRDFVLEAHKMKKLGKKLNATNVSSRYLTFVQEEGA